MGQLERPAQTFMGPVSIAEMSDFLAKQMDGARVSAQLARHEIKPGRLARAVGSDNGRQRTRVKRARYAVHGDVPAELDRQIARFQHGRRGWHPAFPLQRLLRTGMFMS